MKNIPVITIDGPAGVGKGTIVRHIAKKLEWHVLDSGALYRLVALSAIQQNVALNDEIKLARLAKNLEVVFQLKEIILNNEVVTQAVRTEECGRAASLVAVFPKVRAALLQRQHDFKRLPGLIADGRDMGTVVFKEAIAKIFLTASSEIRAERRHKQLREQGINANLTDLIEDIKMRDAKDINRKTSPLKAAKDAIVIDTSYLDIESVVAAVFEIIDVKIK